MTEAQHKHLRLTIVWGVFYVVASINLASDKIRGNFYGLTAIFDVIYMAGIFIAFMYFALRRSHVVPE